MSEYISSDTNIWIDFANISSVEIPFKLDCVYLMYEETFNREVLRPSGIEKQLVDFGIRLVDIDFEEYELAELYSDKYHKYMLSKDDCVAMAIAKTRNITLMTGDGNLRKAAIKEGVDILGTIGVLDRAMEEGKISKKRYVDLLIQLRDYPSSRQPKDEINLRISRYSEG